MNKINVLQIVLDHFGTLRDFQTGKLSASDVCVFFVLPAVGAAACWYFAVNFGSDALVSILTAFSIFAGLLFSLLVLVFSLTEKSDPQSMLYSIRKQLVAELYDNISFAILISMGVVTLTLLAGMKGSPEPSASHAGTVVTSLLVFLMTNFILTMLMVLKRMHALLTQALKEPAKKNVA